MTDYNVTLEVIPGVEEGSVDFSVTVDDGNTFRLGFAAAAARHLGAPSSPAQVTTWQLDDVADELARGIVAQDPTDDQLRAGFRVTLDNGFATPLAAEQNLRNSGVNAFVEGRKFGLSPPLE